MADQERKTPTLRETDLPHLWILVPTFSAAARQHCDAHPDPNLLPGCYRLSPLLGTHLIVLHQLPPTPDTLWLRLLGKGHCQHQAIHEVLALPQATPFRHRVLQLLTNWKIALGTLNPPPSEEEETLMALSQAYLEWEQKTIRLGEERGIRLGEAQGEQRERRRLVLEMLAMEMEFKFDDRGRSLLPYLQAVDNTALLYDFLRSLKPLAAWDQVQQWWFDRLGQGLAPGAQPTEGLAAVAQPEAAPAPGQTSGTPGTDRNESQAASPDPALAVALKLRFPEAGGATIAQVAAQLGTDRLDWSALRPRLEAATAIGAIAGEVNAEG